MYGRTYGDRVLRFEASGGLMHASLVMQDKETDSYWSIMTGDALAGEYAGTRLEELAWGVKTTWEDWREAHPRTLVLSVDGEEHPELNPYEDYFSSPDAFGGLQAADDRLPTKEAIYAFQRGGRAYAIPYVDFAGGGAFSAGGEHLFLYRPQGAALFTSTVAFVSPEGFTEEGGLWRHASGVIFDPEQGGFSGGDVPRLDGFDTFWFNWSMTHPETEVLKP